MVCIKVSQRIQGCGGYAPTTFSDHLGGLLGIGSRREGGFGRVVSIGVAVGSGDRGVLVGLCVGIGSTVGVLVGCSLAVGVVVGLAVVVGVLVGVGIGLGAGGASSLTSSL